jgi:SAM-dependent methyltransferase
MYRGMLPMIPDISPEAFRRVDESPDSLFYLQPRFVTHIDAAAVDAVTQLYREAFPPGGAILDLMSSWVSHLPPEVKYGRVVGVGLNGRELEANRRLDASVVHDLNNSPRLAFETGEFDGAAICVSIQYLTQPVVVLREVGRVLRQGAPLVVTFSNRCFPTKAVAIWQALDDAGHARLVERYLRDAGNWTAIETLSRGSQLPGSDPLFAVMARAAPKPSRRRD